MVVLYVYTKKIMPTAVSSPDIPIPDIPIQVDSQACRGVPRRGKKKSLYVRVLTLHYVRNKTTEFEPRESI